MNALQNGFKLPNWFTGLFKAKTITSDPAKRCCLRIHNKTLLSLSAYVAQNEIVIEHADAIPFDTFENLSYVIAGLAKKIDLHDSNIYWLLSPEDYQLFLIESLPVQANELKDALQWRIRSLINYPFEEAVIDQFKFPAKKPGLESNMLAAIVARGTLLNRVSDIVKNSGLQMSVIDIPELSLKNLAAEFENDEKSTAFVYFYDQAMILNITQKKTLFFTRKINTTPDKQRDYEKTGLELLRYFDYFQSQWRNPPPSRIFIGSDRGDAKTIATALAEYVTTTPESYDLNSLGLNKIDQLPSGDQYLLNFGCILRGVNT